MTRRLTLLTTFLLFFLVAAPEGWALSFQLNRVADPNTPIPGGSGTFTFVSEPLVSGGNVAFLGQGSSGQQGIYLFEGGVLVRVADSNTPIPNGSGNFVFIFLPALSGGNVAFFGQTGFGPEGHQEGIYLFQGGVLSRVADLNTPIPGGSGQHFTNFLPPFAGVISPAHVSGTNVAFRGFGLFGPTFQPGNYLAIPSATPPGPTSPIPTLSEWGIGIMVALMVAVSLWTMRRRSALEDRASADPT